MKRLRWVLLLACLAVVGVPHHGSPASAAPSEARWFKLDGIVTRVVDGDTINVRVEKRNEKVRLLGIDAPERGSCFYEKSRAQLQGLVLRREVSLTGDRSQRRRDRYGRLLAYLAVGSFEIGQAQVQYGYATVSTVGRPFQRVAQYSRFEKGAARGKRGMWASTACDPSADLRVAIQASPSNPLPGTPVTFTYTITNAGPWVTPLSQLEATFVGGEPTTVKTTSGACRNEIAPVDCELNRLARGQTASVVAVVQASAAGPLTTTASVGWPLDDPNSANNTASASVVVALP
jgi:endonuclease YncB( thermonuclease family)